MLLLYLLPINLSRSAFALHLTQKPSSKTVESLEVPEHSEWLADPQHFVFLDIESKNSLLVQPDKRNSNPFQDAFQEAVYHLEYMTRKLSFFVNETDFDCLAFEYWSEDYKVYLSDSNVIAKLADYSKELQDKLTYTRFLYKVMADTNNDFKRFGDRLSLSFIIFYQMAVIKLRAVLLLLPRRTSHPKPKKLAESLISLRHDVSFLDERFSKLARIPVDIRLRFGDQVKLVRDVIVALEEMIKQQGNS